MSQNYSENCQNTRNNLKLQCHCTFKCWKGHETWYFDGHTNFGFVDMQSGAKKFSLFPSTFSHWKDFSFAIALTSRANAKVFPFSSYSRFEDFLWKCLRREICEATESSISFCLFIPLKNWPWSAGTRDSGSQYDAVVGWRENEEAFGIFREKRRRFGEGLNLFHLKLFRVLIRILSDFNFYPIFDSFNH